MSARVRWARSGLTLSVLASAATACSDTAAGPGDPPAILSAALAEVPVPLVRALTVELDRPGRVEVTYQAEGVPALRVVADSIATRHRLTLARLYPDKGYVVAARALDDAGDPGVSWRGEFRTAALPPEFASIRLTAEGAPSKPLEISRTDRADAFIGFAVIDAQGRVVWYYRTQGSANGSLRLPDRSLALIDEGRGLLKVDPAGQLLGRVPQDSASRRIHHDVALAPDGALLFIAQDWRLARGTQVAGEAIWEWRPESGALRRRWTAWDYLDPTVEWGPVSTPADWLHANALSIGPRGNVILSFHYLNSVLSIAPGFGGLEWRIGGLGNLNADAGERFTGQHTPAEVAPDRVLMFDNGFERVNDRYSRAVEFVLDHATGRATKVWEWRPQPDIWARIVGLARRLSNGDTFVAMGTGPGFNGSTGPVSAYEVRSDGSVAWRLTVSGVSLMYRMWPLDDIAGEQPAP